jgi:threonine/homoserine/homoserine lactone efflux protein
MMLLAGIGLGFSLAAPPGPMNALIAREASTRGSLSGIRVGLGGPAADMVFLSVFVIGLGGLLAKTGWIRIGAIIGSVIMAWFAVTTLLATKSAEKGLPTEATFITGLLVGLANPYQIAWWISGGFVLLHSQGYWGIAGFLTGILGWVFLFPWLVAHGAQRWKWFQTGIKGTSAVILGVFSLVLLAVATGMLEI